MVTRAALRLVGLCALLMACGARTPLDDLGEAGDAAPAPDGAALRVTSLSLGYDFSCALLSDATARCWGEGASGQLGTTTSADAVVVPISIVNPAGILALSGGYDQSCAVLEDGVLACWGGQPGSGAGSASSPVAPTAIGAGFLAVSAGFEYGCGVRTDGTVACWGYGDHGQLGNDESASFVERVPTTVAGARDAVAVSASEYLTCARTQGGGVICWGLGPIGDGSLQDSTSPVSVGGLTQPATQLAVGGMHACALLQDGTVACWGYGGYGKLGLGAATVYAPLPQTVDGEGPAVAISSGEYHSCAILTTGRVACWGTASTETRVSFFPALVDGIDSAIAIGSGQSHDCALLENGKVVCWGDNGSGQLGDGTTVPSATPVEVTGLP